MTPERIAEIRSMPHDNWRIVHELLDAIDAANASASEAQGTLLDILRDLGLGACAVADARGAVGRAVQAIKDERDALAHEVELTNEHEHQIMQERDEARRLLGVALPHVWASAEAEHMLDGFKRKPRPLDALVEEIRGVLNTEGAKA